ncbi:MAG: hypothetical protein IJ672_09145 [Methanobrevibacter sp.]|nr:hypothetical protein [Methanobrevibacter sp.]
MKLSIRCTILVTVMVILSIVMYQVGMKVVIPYIINSNDDLVLTFGLIFGEIGYLIVWVSVFGFLMKVLNCGEIIDKFIDRTEK